MKLPQLSSVLSRFLPKIVPYSIESVLCWKVAQSSAPTLNKIFSQRPLLHLEFKVEVSNSTSETVVKFKPFQPRKPQTLLCAKIPYPTKTFLVILLPFQLIHNINPRPQSWIAEVKWNINGQSSVRQSSYQNSKPTNDERIRPQDLLLSVFSKEQPRTWNKSVPFATYSCEKKTARTACESMLLSELQSEGLCYGRRKWVTLELKSEPRDASK